ncbi:MAG: hypothetical protein WKF84_23535 [Pyrinomonadaceae bacterium]
MDVLPGIDNELGRPMFLPKVNDGIQMPLDESGVVTQDTTFELPVVGGEPPIRITAKAGTRVTFPPDVTDKRLSVTRIATNRVPMVLEDGRAASLYISVQPSGALFETPLEISFPNLDRLPANSEVLLMSFDHDAGRYVRVGTGHVSADGRVVVSDPNNGIRVGAWHALPPPEPESEVTVLGHIQVEGNSTFEGKDIVSAEAWVEGTRAVLTTAPASLSEAKQLSYRATFSLPRNASVRLAKMEATTVVLAAKAKVVEVTFGGDRFHTVSEDTGTAYGTPHWKDANGNGNASDGGDKRFPISFARDSLIKVSATFKLEEPIERRALKVFGDGPGDLDFEATVTAEGNSFQISKVQSKGKLPNTVKFYNPLQIEWKVSFDNGKKFRSAGKTDNRVYVMLSDPTTPVLYETLLDVGCRNADGKTTNTDVVAAIWADFAGPIPGVKRKKMDGHNVTDGVGMRYWNPEISTCQSYNVMLQVADGNGSCIAWSQLLHHTLKAQGIAGSEIYELTPDLTLNPDAEGFMVKLWNYGKHIRTGNNSVLDSAVLGDDVAISVTGPRGPDQPAIAPGHNGVLDSARQGDDTVYDGLNRDSNPNYPLMLRSESS